MDEKAKVPRRPQTKAERIKYLLNLVNKWIKEGHSSEEAVEKLSLKQYDFLINADVDLDALLLTDAQQEAIKAVTRAPRPLFPNGYKKKYPESKQELYRSIEAHILTQGAVIAPRERENFRDLDFTIDGTAYRIVLSQPRPSKKS